MTRSTKPKHIDPRIQLVYLDLLAGQSNIDIMAKYGQSWGVAPRTMRRYVAKAELLVQKMTERTRETADLARIDEVVKYETRRTLSREEKREILAKIAMGELEVEKVLITKTGIQRVMCKPDHADRVKAIDLENKMQGHYAADRIQLEGGEGMAPIINIVTVLPAPDPD